jgi:RimJ/RimL family protein N-acetyltransferase
MILRYLANLAKERNCGRLEWSVLDWNEPAITFYRKIGAEPMEDWTVFRLHGENLKKLAEMNSKTNSF